MPAAHKHVKRERDDSLRFVGYIIDYAGCRYYHAGDTRLHELLLNSLADAGPIDVAFLPVNECNFFRDRRGIIGNMSVRDAFELADEIGARAVVPMHYDMFAPNCVYVDEIEAVYRNARPKFRLVLDPADL